MAQLRGQVSLTIRDFNGAKASTNQEVNVNDASTIATLKTFADGFATTLDSITGGVIEEVRLCLILPLPVGLKTVADDNIDVTQTGTFNYDNGSPYHSPLVVPALDDVLVVGGQIDLSPTSVSDLNAWMTSAHATHQIVSKSFNNLVALVDALFSFRKRRSAISRRSFPEG